MRRRAFLTLTLLPSFARAQPAQRGSVTPGQGRPDPSAQRRAELDRLFEALKDAPDTAGAQLVESRIRAVWAQAVSPAAGLLLRRGVRNLNGNAADEALEDFDAALILEPGAADLWLMRARAYAQLGDRAGAARDLREALRLEPRHFGAMLQLSELLEEAGDAAGALRMLDAVLALHPKMPTGEQRRRELQRKAEGDAL